MKDSSPVRPVATIQFATSQRGRLRAVSVAPTVRLRGYRLRAASENARFQAPHDALKLGGKPRLWARLSRNVAGIELEPWHFGAVRNL